MHKLSSHIFFLKAGAFCILGHFNLFSYLKRHFQLRDFTSFLPFRFLYIFPAFSLTLFTFPLRFLFLSILICIFPFILATSETIRNILHFLSLYFSVFASFLFFFSISVEKIERNENDFGVYLFQSKNGTTKNKLPTSGSGQIYVISYVHAPEKSDSSMMI